MISPRLARITALLLAVCLWPLAVLAGEDAGLEDDYRLSGTEGRQALLPISALMAEAKAGDMQAQHRLGERYLKGLKVPQHFDQARQWFLRAALQGDSQAMYELAELLSHGKCGERDLPQAYFWYNLAAAYGIKGAARRRDQVLRRLDPKEVVKLQDRALAWRPRPERAK